MQSSFLLSTVFIRNTLFLQLFSYPNKREFLQRNRSYAKKHKAEKCNHLKKMQPPQKNATTHLKMQPLRLRVSLHYSVSYIFRLFGSKETGAFSAVSLYAVFSYFTYFCKIKNATILYQSLRLDVVAGAGFEPTTFGL